MNKHTYSIDLKVYELANMYEIPWQVPEDMVDLSGNLKLGVHTVGIQFTEEQFEEFMDWCTTHGAVLKVLGTERLD